MTAKDLKAALLQEAVQGKLVPQIESEGDARDLLEEIREQWKVNSEQKKNRHAEPANRHAESANCHAELVSASSENRSRTLENKKQTDLFALNSTHIKKAKTVRSEQIRLSISDEEKPFDIPQSWCWCRLGEICTKITDGTHKTPKYVNKGIPFLSVKNLSSGRIDFSNVKYITPEEHKVLYSRCNPEKGDMLLTKVGTTGIPVLNDSDIEFSLFVSVALLKFPHQFINEKYFLYLLQSPLVQTQAKENTKGVGNKNWVIDSILKTVLTLPPLAEQKRIVAALEKILPLVEEYGKKEETLAKLNADISSLAKKAVLQEAVQGKLVPQIESEGDARDLLAQISGQWTVESGQKNKTLENRKQTDLFALNSTHIKKAKTVRSEQIRLSISDEEKPFDIPQSWCWCRLGEIVSILGDGIHGTPIYDMQGEYYFINGNNLSEGIIEIKQDTKKVNEVEFQKYKKELNENTVFVSINGTLGNVAFYNNEKIILGKSACYFNLFRKEMKAYIFYLIKTKYFLDYANEQATGTTIKNVSLASMRNFPIPLPPLAEQKRIVAALEKILPLCEKLGK